MKVTRSLKRPLRWTPQTPGLSLVMWMARSDDAQAGGAGMLVIAPVSLR
jgi:hypothetical protein